VLVRLGTSPGMISCTPANSVLVQRLWPRSVGFSRISTRRSASSGLITRRLEDVLLDLVELPDLGDAFDFGSLVTTLRSTSQSGARSCLLILS
jgi:hypothetical protein